MDPTPSRNSGASSSTRKAPAQRQLSHERVWDNVAQPYYEHEPARADVPPPIDAIDAPRPTSFQSTTLHQPATAGWCAPSSAATGLDGGRPRASPPWPAPERSAERVDRAKRPFEASRGHDALVHSSAWAQPRPPPPHGWGHEPPGTAGRVLAPGSTSAVRAPTPVVGNAGEPWQLGAGGGQVQNQHHRHDAWYDRDRGHVDAGRHRVQAETWVSNSAPPVPPRWANWAEPWPDPGAGSASWTGAWPRPPATFGIETRAREPPSYADPTGHHAPTMPPQHAAAAPWPGRPSGPPDTDATRRSWAAWSAWNTGTAAAATGPSGWFTTGSRANDDNDRFNSTTHSTAHATANEASRFGEEPSTWRPPAYLHAYDSSPSATACHADPVQRAVHPYAEPWRPPPPMPPPPPPPRPPPRPPPPDGWYGPRGGWPWAAHDEFRSSSSGSRGVADARAGTSWRRGAPSGPHPGHHRPVGLPGDAPATPPAWARRDAAAGDAALGTARWESSLPSNMSPWSQAPAHLAGHAGGVVAASWASSEAEGGRKLPGLGARPFIGEHGEWSVASFAPCNTADIPRNSHTHEAATDLSADVDANLGTAAFHGVDRSTHRRAAHHHHPHSHRTLPGDEHGDADADADADLPQEGDESDGDLGDNQDDDDENDDDDRRRDTASAGLTSSSRTAPSSRPSKSADRRRRGAGQAPPRNFHVFTRAQYDLMVRCLELQRNVADLPRLRELWKTVADTARGRKRWKRLQENLALVANHESAPRYERITWMHSSLIIAPQEEWPNILARAHQSDADMASHRSIRQTALEVRRKYETRRSRCGITPDVIDALCHRCACYTTISDQAGQLDLAASAPNP